jgi:inosine-uridine nucleoside N-ribohydrolase
MKFMFMLVSLIVPAMIVTAGSSSRTAVLELKDDNNKLAQPAEKELPEPIVTAKATIEKIPVILDTDIGTDIDDTWALAMMLKSPELDVKMVVTDTGNTTYRAKVVARMLEVAGRTDVPVGIGLHLSDDEGGQAGWVKDYDLSSYPGKVYKDGVGAMIDVIMKSPTPITLICIGPVPNISNALEREPRIAKKAKFVGMHGSVRKGYNGSDKVSAEYNVACYPKDCQKAFIAAWDMTITPLDTCGLVVLQGEKYKKVLDSKDPIAKAVIENYNIWAKGTPDKSSVLFDTVAIYLSFAHELLVMEKLGIRVTDDGFTVEDPKAKMINCAMEWKDLPAFEDFLVERLVK